jgi:aspartate/glutamate racemase
MNKKVYGGKNTYGEIIGIIMGERTFPRIPGDMGNATTFDFPVRLHVVKSIDVSTRLRLFSGSTEFIKPFVEAAKQLEEIGVKAITSNCGFIVQYQDVISNSVNIPVFTSSLLQIPLVYKMLNKDQIIGMLTADGSPKGLGKKHLKAAGAKEIPVVIRGMENAENFKALNENKGIIYPEKIKEELVTTAEELIKDYPKIGAIVLECANMPAYSKFIQEATKLPVFDFVTLTNWVYSAIVKNK